MTTSKTAAASTAKTAAKKGTSAKATPAAKAAFKVKPVAKKPAAKAAPDTKPVVRRKSKKAETAQHEQQMKDIASDMQVGTGAATAQGALFDAPVAENKASVAAAQATIETQTTIETNTKETVTMSEASATPLPESVVLETATGSKIEAVEVTTDLKADKTYVIVDDKTKRVSVVLKGKPDAEQQGLLERTFGTMYELVSDAAVKVGDLVYRGAVFAGELTMTVLKKTGNLILQGVKIIGEVSGGVLRVIGGGIVMLAKGVDSIIMGGFTLTENVVGGTVNVAEGIIGGACTAVEEIGCAVGDTLAEGIDDVFRGIFGWLSSNSKPAPVAVAA
jgi:hypothetical protein